MFGSDPPPLKPPPYGGRPKFVKLAPGDRGLYLEPVYYEDPRTFTGKPGVHGRIVQWGLCDTDEDNLPDIDIPYIMHRKFLSQFDYMNGRISPEQQFVHVLKERKINQLSIKDVGERPNQDVILRVSLACIKKNGKDRIWRRFRVSAGIKLSVFQDKILTPIMGWTRNLHAYVFTDFSDGALFGPEGMTSIDHLHWISACGHDYLSDDKYLLAHMFEKEGDVFGYFYDLGDKWFHDIEVEKIFPPDESYGRAEIIDGKGMCPGENMQGCWTYAKFLTEYDTAPPSQKAKKKREILDKPNYREFGTPISRFDPLTFDKEHTNQCLSEALASRNSVRAGAKSFKTLFREGDDPTDLERNLKKGQSVTKNHRALEGGFWQEIESNVKDKKSQTICAECGKPGKDLKTCGGCRQILYCSAEHQKTHWKSVHKQQCSRAFLKQ